MGPGRTWRHVVPLNAHLSLHIIWDQREVSQRPWNLWHALRNNRVQTDFDFAFVRKKKYVLPLTLCHGMLGKPTQPISSQTLNFVMFNFVMFRTKHSPSWGNFTSQAPSLLPKGIATLFVSFSFSFFHPLFLLFIKFMGICLHVCGAWGGQECKWDLQGMSHG